MVDDKDRSQAEEIFKKYDNPLDFFSYELQPLCPIIGLSEDLFWNGDPELFFAYLDAYNKRQEQEYKMKDSLAHAQGMYNMLAITQVVSNVFNKSPKKIYPEKPFSLTEKPKPLTAEEVNEAWMGYLTKKFGEQGNGRK